MKVYLAGPFGWRDEIQAFADELEVLGISVTSSWLQETVSVNCTLDQLAPEYTQQAASTGVREIEQADLLAGFTIDPLGPAKPRGGRHWETGFARGLGKEIVVIGPRENIFHFLPEVKQFDSKEDAKQYLLLCGCHLSRDRRAYQLSSMPFTQIGLRMTDRTHR